MAVDQSSNPGAWVTWGQGLAVPSEIQGHCRALGAPPDD